MNPRRSYWLKCLCLSVCCSIFLLIFKGTFAGASDAQEESSDESGIGETIENWVNSAHQKISAGIVQTSERFDKFFGDERVKEEQESTQLIATPTLIFSEEDTLGFSCPLTFNVALPHIEKRWNLMLETLLKEEDAADDEDGSGDLVEENDVTVSLQYKILQQAERWLSFDVGVKVQADNIINPLGKMRFRRVFELDSWALRLIQVVFWIEDEGWGESSQLDIDHQLRENLLFRLTNHARWSESSDGLEFSQTLMLRWQLSGRRAVGIELVGQGHTRPSWKMDEYRASVIYRRRLYKNWLFSEIEPGIQMLREDDFDMAPFVMISLECTFGEIAEK